MKINGVSYNVEDIRTAIKTAVKITPNAEITSSIEDKGDAFTIYGIENIALFRTEGKYKVVAIPHKDITNPGYVLINKHALKKTHATFVATDSIQQLQERFNTRPNNNQRRNSRDHHSQNYSSNY